MKRRERVRKRERKRKKLGNNRNNLWVSFALVKRRLGFRLSGLFFGAWTIVPRGHICLLEKSKQNTENTERHVLVKKRRRRRRRRRIEIEREKNFLKKRKSE